MGKTLNITYCEFVFAALGIQHAERMYRIALPSVVSPDVIYFSTFSHKRRRFRKIKNLAEYKMSYRFSSQAFS
jgi:hypothetical protein